MIDFDELVQKYLSKCFKYIGSTWKIKHGTYTINKVWIDYRDKAVIFEILGVMKDPSEGVEFYIPWAQLSNFDKEFTVADRPKIQLTVKEYITRHLDRHPDGWEDILINHPCMDDLMLVDDENFKKLVLGYQNHVYQINRVLEENGYEAG